MLRTGNLDEQQSIGWRRTGGGTASPADFAPGTDFYDTLDFLPGENSKQVFFEIQDDFLFEQPENYFIQLLDPSPAAVFQNSRAEGVILSADCTEIFAEMLTPTTVRLTRIGDLSGSQVVNWAVATGVARAADFAGGVLPSGAVTFLPGRASVSFEITVAVDDDPTDESYSVHFSLPAGNANNVGLVTPSISSEIPTTCGELHITAIGPTAAPETVDGVTEFTFEVTRDGRKAYNDVLFWALIDDLGEGYASPADLVNPNARWGFLEFFAEDSVTSSKVSVAEDGLVEGDERLSVGVFGFSLNDHGSMKFADVTASVTILGDLPEPDTVVAITEPTAPAYEGLSVDEAVHFTLTRSGNSDESLSIGWALLQNSDGKGFTSRIQADRRMA